LIQKFTQNFSKITNNNFPRRNPKMTGIELLILVGGCYALYTVGMAIATELDYRAFNRAEIKELRRQNDKLLAGLK
tara:strand:- start:1283 stop:1510 length:228 start_codon:yes stop_codon:yes gene_type:complete